MPTHPRTVRPRRAAALLAILAALLAAALAPAAASAAADRLRVGAATLHRCHADREAWCGTLRRPLDPARPRGATVPVGFRWYPAANGSAGRPTLVAMEGGPGYPATGTSVEYREMYGPLLRERDLLLVDMRGTGSPA